MMRVNTTGLVYEEAYLRHVTPQGHPESPARLEAIMSCLEQQGLLGGLVRIAPAETKLEWIHAVHSPAYVQKARDEILSGRFELSTGDTCVCPDSYDAALQAVGGVVAAVDAVAAGRVKNAFCAVRPPGHHATPDAGMGFCIFNNAAIAARYAQRNCGMKKVLIYDWDVHHGNGTQDAFYEDGAVFYCSTHLAGLYPMPLTGKGHAGETGRGDGVGTNLNIPLPPDSGDEEVLGALRRQMAPAAEKFAPDLVIISAGFDSRLGDPLGMFRITDEGFAELTRLAGSLAGGRVVSVLEGGYDLSGLASAAAAHVKALMEA